MNQWQNKFPAKNCTQEKVYYNTTSAVYTRLSVNWDMVKHYEALGLLTTPAAVAQFCVNNWRGGGTTFRRDADNFGGNTSYYIPPF